MLNQEDFKKYFDKNFWKAFKNLSPIFGDISTNTQKEILTNLYEEIINRRYYPSIPKTYLYSNKGNGVTRSIPVFEIKDYCVYYYCIKRLENKIAINRIENTFGGWSLGGLMRKSEEEEIKQKTQMFNMQEEIMADNYGISISEYSFNPKAWSKWYGDFNSKLFVTSLESDCNWVVELDISNFYDCIRLDLLEIWIREISDVQASEEVSLLFHFLNFWNRKVNSYNKQTVGIPQDALSDCSRILANFYLQQYDLFVSKICEKHSCKYLRYADDQFIFGEKKETLEYLVFLLSIKLNQFGLNINQKKVEYRKSSDLIKHRSFEIFDEVREENSQNPISVEQFLDRYFELRDQSNLIDFKNKGIPLLNKAIYCNLKEISIGRKHKIIGYLLEESFLKQAKRDQFIKLYDLLENSQKIKLIKHLLSIAQSTYHTVFHYEVLKFFQKINHDFAPLQERIEKLEKNMLAASKL